MQAAPPLLSFLLILLHSGWSHGLCKLENSTVAWCDKLEDLGQIETYHLEMLTAPIAQDTLIPGLFDNLTNLRHLDMSGGDLKTIEPGSFRALNHLRSLDLSDNHIEHLELASLEGLINLRTLNLRKNAIRQLPPVLVRLKHLRHLDIFNNPLVCNCTTLKVRDLIVQRKVSISKKVICSDPSNLKGTSLMKPSAAIICNFEQQDHEMQNDQAVEGSGMYSGSGDDVLNEFNSEEEEYTVGSNVNSSEKPEVETPSPTERMDSSTGSSVIESTTSVQESTIIEEITSATMNSLQRTIEDEEIFFDNEEKKEQISTTEMSRKEDFKDALFYPTTGSGDGDEDGSGEGSGIVWTHYDKNIEKSSTKDDSSSSSFAETIWDMIFGSTATTEMPSETKDPDLVQEEFIDASSTKLATEESIASSESPSVKSEIGKISTEMITIANGVEVLKSAGKSKSGNVKAELAEVSPAKQSKKGMGSYIVLAILVAVVATLIGFAAYRGDICRKKRKRGDVENGTELRDMQKSLLPDTGNSTQLKIASNGNPENTPLVEGTSDGDDAKVDKIQSDHQPIQETTRSLNGTTDQLDPVKPPRKLISSQDDQKSEDRPRVDINSLRENFLADRTSPTQPSDSSLATINGSKAHMSEPNGPPLSPGAQRVKITLQENPDSVPKTPILITRTMAGENLVKTP